MGRWFFLFLLSLPVAGFALGNEVPRLLLRDGLMPEALNGGSAALSGDIYNPADVSVTVVGASSPLAGQTLLQEYGTDEVGARVVKVLARLEIPAKGTISLVPGMLELRLVGLNADLKAGNELPLYIKTEDGSTQVLRVNIIKGYAN